jgi:hypothetical protein
VTQSLLSFPFILLSSFLSWYYLARKILSTLLWQVLWKLSSGAVVSSSGAELWDNFESEMQVTV